MNKTLSPLLSTIDIYISENPEASLHISLYPDFYQQILQSNRNTFNFAYDPPKLLGHSFSVLDNIDSEKQFFVTSETALLSGTDAYAQHRSKIRLISNVND